MNTDGRPRLQGDPAALRARVAWFDWFDWFDSLRSLTTGRSPAPSEVEGLTTGRSARSPGCRSVEPRLARPPSVLARGIADNLNL